MFDILFDVPWWLPAAPIAVGGVVVFTGMRRLEGKVTRAGLAILLLGVLIGLLSYFIDTARERAIRRTHALVSTAIARDWQGFAALIDPPGSFDQPMDVWLALGAVGVFGSALSLTLYLRLLTFARATEAALVSYLQPVWATLIAAVWLGETPGLRELAGGAVVLGGVWLASTRRPR